MRGPGSRSALLLAVLAILLGSLGTPRAETPADVLHEFVPLGPLRCEGGTCRRAGAGADPDDPHGLPEAIETGGNVLDAPTGGAFPRVGEQVYSPQPLEPVVAGGTPPFAGDPPPSRRDRIRPDRETAHEPPGKHRYHEVFNPAIFPFKRMTALDAVDEGETLYVASPAPRVIPLRGGAPTPGDSGERFWGSVVIDFSPATPGRWVGLPSVAPGSRIVSYRAEPVAQLEFGRDGADNLFVRSSVTGLHRLTWLEEAPPGYFGGPLPPGWRARISDEPAGMVRPLPEKLRRRAARVIGALGIDRSRPLAEVLGVLVAWFRDFSQGALAAPSESTYLDLALAKRGACRHRSFAFTITALALGIPTRYVENELHVFVEVYLPKLGWRRINLGGAAVDEEVTNMDGKVAHQPRGGDPFPRPPAFVKSEPRRGGDRSPVAENGKGNGGGGDGGGGGNGGRGASPPTAESKPPPAPATPPEASSTTTPAAATTPATPPSAPPPVAGSAPPPLAATTLTVTAEGREAFRGDAIQIRGQLRATGASPAGVRVALELTSAGAHVPLGDAVTGSDGDFSLTVELPRTVPLGHYRVVAHTIADGRLAPARSSAAP